MAIKINTIILKDFGEILFLVYYYLYLEKCAC